MTNLSPDQVIVASKFADFCKTQYPDLPVDTAFEIFAAGLVLKTLGLDASDIRRGIVGGTLDGGIDGFYILLNKTELVDSTSVRLTARKASLDGLQPGVPLDIYVIQAKNEKSWDSEALSKLRDVLEVLLDGEKTVADLRAYPLRDDVIEMAVTLRRLRGKLINLVPSVTFHICYVSLAKQQSLDRYRESKRKQVEMWLKSKNPARSDVAVRFIGDEVITELLSKSADFKATLKFVKVPVREGGSLVGLAKIQDYVNFVRRDRSKAIRDEMFAVNVRDFAGHNIHVNAAIRSTLENDSKSAFWWLNNGITIIADKIDDPDETTWVLTNPMIVNGLQTSHVLHTTEIDGLITKKRSKESLMVRVINDSDPAVRESVIIGTNNQTAVGSLQLHANEPLQVRLEEFLRAKGWFYERRKYQYRGTTVPAARIRNITEVAQAIMAVHLLAPDTARARPNSLLSKKTGYDSVFSASLNEELYDRALLVMDAIEKYLGTASAKAVADDPTNARYYIASGYIINSLKLKSLQTYSGSASINQIDASPNSAALLRIHKALYKTVNSIDDGKVARDGIFKGAALKPLFFKAVQAMR